MPVASLIYPEKGSDFAWPEYKARHKKCVENTSLLFPETSEVSHSYYIRTLYIQDLRFRLSPVRCKPMLYIAIRAVSLLL